MTQFSNDDKNLVNFLRQHHPNVPPPSPELEEEILQNVKTLHIRPRPERHHFDFWLIPPALAAGLVATVLSYHAFVPTQPHPTELTNLEAFIESNWHSVSDNPGLDVLSSIEYPTD